MTFVQRYIPTYLQYYVSLYLPVETIINQQAYNKTSTPRRVVIIL